MAATQDPPHHISTTSLFNSLLEQSRKLRQDTEPADLPAIQLGLGEIERRARELKRAAPGEHPDAQARYLLAAGGIDTDEALRDLETIDFQTVYEPSAPVDTDINAYLRSRRDQNVTASIEESMRRTTRDFDTFVGKNVTMEWDAQRQRIFEHFGLGSRAAKGGVAQGFNGGLSTFGASTFGRSRLGNGNGVTSGGGSVWATKSMNLSVLGRSMMNGKPDAKQETIFSDVDVTRRAEPSKMAKQRQRGFGDAVRSFNTKRLEGDFPQQTVDFKIMHAFALITENCGTDLLTQQLTDSWKLLASIVGETATDGPQERQFVVDYILNPEVDSPAAARIRKKIESGARTFLEQQFHNMLSREVNENPVIARIGGVPSTINKFHGYIRIKMVRNKDLPEWDLKNFDLLDDTPCWALIFYLLRAGFVAEADQYVRDHLTQFQKLDRGFATYIHAYATNEDRRLPKNLHDRIQGEYNNRVRYQQDSRDPFKPAIYKIIGRCELAKRSVPVVLPTAEDWMWLQLVLAREIERSTEPAHEVFTLHDLQKSIQQFGARHFNAKGANAGLYFMMLLMCGLFEEAVAYLYAFQPVDGIHFAMALTYYGLLRPTDDPKNMSELLKTGSKGERQIQFPRLIGNYIMHDLTTPNPAEGVDYLTFVCLNGDLPGTLGQAHLEIAHQALRELVLDTRRFTQLLGDVHADGTTGKGLIQERLPLLRLGDSSDLLRTITQQAAVQAETDGRTADAVLLYHQCEEFDTVVNLLAKKLSDHIALESESAKFREPHVEESKLSLTSLDHPAALARYVLRMYDANPAISRVITPRARDALLVLQQINQAKLQYEDGHYQQCLGTIDRCDVIPLEPYINVSEVRRRAQNFGALSEVVARTVAMLLMMSVDCCSRLGKELRESRYVEGERGDRIRDLKAKSQNAMIYAGLIQYKLPANVYAFLNSREVVE